MAEKTKKGLILGIESTCDDSSVAIYSLKEKKILQEVSYSSRKEYHKYGGIVPEIAARNHEDKLVVALEECLSKANLKLEDLTHIAYSAEPGLESSLLVGKMLATTLSETLDKPLFPVNHLESHVLSVGLQEKLDFPSLCLLITGKNTIIYHLTGDHIINKLEECQDCALGEAYDKVARIMGLKYPGGPLLQDYYSKYKSFPPLTKRSKDSSKLSLNFSGLITASSRYWESLDSNMSLDKKREALSTAFQKEIVEIIFVKLDYWIKNLSISSLYIVGGVSKNTVIKEYLLRFCEVKNIKCSFVSEKLAEDNGSMIAYRASFLI
ncbi:Probable O-sialoglycoprotein endopeptidase (Glycoprotease) [Mycoplasma suis KI3806]|uniref:N(6)-L-threonylcarbamoyladenine synthase n=1 Tax=Mycoplasma suis (strain KI_3806) TaxID=708248 RepID=F0V2T8_MYCS3|nr:tRNA (adenosine(37)-N6)-threonylcarbamoyltransferase complex transferase subunit TsaD [Mycoplasma suis]CBZ40160.1 Probable O-sialoglycoprotein endopeptidase (Glycoprotease) [Mycoplasma suis KI3806]